MCVYVFDMRKWNRLILFDDIFDQRFFKERHPNVHVCGHNIYLYEYFIQGVFFFRKIKTIYNSLK